MVAKVELVLWLFMSDGVDGMVFAWREVGSVVMVVV